MYYQGVASGGLEDTFRFGARNDYLVNVDGQKAGLWQGFSIYLHGETDYGESVNAGNRSIPRAEISPVSLGVQRIRGRLTHFTETAALRPRPLLNPQTSNYNDTDDAETVFNRQSSF